MQEPLKASVRKLINVDRARLLAGKRDCIRIRLSAPEAVELHGRRVEIRGPSTVTYDARKLHGASVWVRTEAPVLIQGSRGKRLLP